MDVQPDFMNNVVLAGGTTMGKGFSDRIKEEVISNLDVSFAHAVNVVPDSCGNEPGYNSQRKLAAWIGGSILASLDTFSKIQVTKLEYEDSGTADIVHRKAVS